MSPQLGSPQMSPRRTDRARRWRSIALAAFAALGAITSLGGLAGCERRVEAMTSAEVAAALQGQPPIVHLEEGAVTLEGMEGFHLYQSREDALAELAKWCPRTTDYEGDWKRDNTTFKGCKTPDHPWMETIRIGFHPELGDRVFTIEHKRETVPLDAVRARVTAAFGDELVEDVPRRGILMMGTLRYKIFADHDEGQHGVAHVLVGIAPSAISGG